MASLVRPLHILVEKTFCAGSFYGVVNDGFFYVLHHVAVKRVLREVLTDLLQAKDDGELRKSK